MMSLGKKTMQSKSSEKNINMQILTEAEIVSVNDHGYGILWSMKWLEAQGCGEKDNILL